MPKVSVVMSVYNGEEYLKDSISSILSQDFTDFDFIIINDGSTDNSLEVIKSFNDQRIKLISRENRGLIYSLNEAISCSDSEYIARMDADDISLPNRLSRQIEVLKNLEIDLLGSWAIKINEKNEEIGTMSYPPASHKEIKIFFIKHNPFIHSSVMIRRSVLNSVGLYNQKYKHAEDYELWGRVLCKFKGSNIQENLIKYRINSFGVTKKHNLSMRYQGFKIRILFLLRLCFNFKR